MAADGAALGAVGTARAVYGGDRPLDDSGHLHYVRIEYAGGDSMPGDDYGAFSFQGVGSRTEVDHVMAYRPFGDCLEFHGGTVSVKRALCIGGEDDSFDWKEGWQGKAQFIIIMQDGENPAQGVEGGNNEDGHDREPRAQPQIYNLTVIGNYGVRGVLPETDDPLSNNGILLRRGTGAVIRNFIVTGFARSAVEINHAATFALAADERLSFASGIVDHNCAMAACRGQFVTDEDDMAAPRPPSSTSRTKVWTVSGHTDESEVRASRAAMPAQQILDAARSPRTVRITGTTSSAARIPTCL